MNKADRLLYLRAWDRAQFFRWSAQKGFDMPGGDGQAHLFGKYSIMLGKWRREEGVAGHKAMARVNLERCRELRRNS
jgi:hypothetical protein